MACKTQTQIGQAAWPAALQVPKITKKRNKIKYTHTRTHTLDNKNKAGKRVKTKHAKNLHEKKWREKKPNVVVAAVSKKSACVAVAVGVDVDVGGAVKPLSSSDGDGDLDVTYKLNARSSRLKAVCLL